MRHRKNSDSQGVPESASSYDELGKMLGYTRQALSRYAKEPGAPKRLPGDRLDVAAWRVYLSKRSKAREMPIDEKKAKARKIAAEAALKEHELAVRQGLFVDAKAMAEEERRHYERFKTLFKQKFLMELPPLFAGLTVSEIQNLILKGWNDIAAEMEAFLHTDE